MKQIFIFMTMAIFLVGCGGGSSSSPAGSVPSDDTNNTPDVPDTNNTPDIPGSDVSMVISQIYTVFPGDQVIKTAPEALVSISHVDGEDESTVVLLEGSATIARQ